MARLPVREHRKQCAAAGPDLAGLEPFVANYRIEERHSTETWFEEWGTNWKSLVENFMEGYHLSVTHATTLDSITPTELCESWRPARGSPPIARTTVIPRRSANRSRKI